MNFLTANKRLGTKFCLFKCYNYICICRRKYILLVAKASSCSKAKFDLWNVTNASYSRPEILIRDCQACYGALYVSMAGDEG